MNVFIVGNGKLARELLEQPLKFTGCRVRPWDERGSSVTRAVVVHAGSGRELPDVGAFCEETTSPLLELSTGSELMTSSGFPIVICANTNILMLKFMSMLRTSGHLFLKHRISVTESHQATKKSLPGTALHIAESLGIGACDVLSVRDPEYQRSALGLSTKSLDRHAFHEVVIEADGCTLSLQSRVEGSTPYVEGVASIVRAVSTHPLENRLYDVIELVELGWL